MSDYGRQRRGDPSNHSRAFRGFIGKLPEVPGRLPASPVLHQVGQHRVEAEGVAALDGRARPVVLEPRGRAALLQLDLAERLGVAPHLVSLRSRRRPQPGAPLLHQVHRFVAPRHRGGQLAGPHQTLARAKQRDTPVALQQVPDRLTADEGLRREFVESVDRHPTDAHDAFPSLRRVERVAGPTRAPALEHGLERTGAGVDIDRARVVEIRVVVPGAAAAANFPSQPGELKRLLQLRRGLQRLQQRPPDRRRGRVRTDPSPPEASTERGDPREGDVLDAVAQLRRGNLNPELLRHPAALPRRLGGPFEKVG